MDLKKVVNTLNGLWGLWGILLGLFFVWWALTPIPDSGPIGTVVGTLPGDSGAAVAQRAYVDKALHDLKATSRAVNVLVDAQEHPAKYASYTDSHKVVEAKVDIALLASDWGGNEMNVAPQGYEEFHALFSDALRELAAGCGVMASDAKLRQALLSGGALMRDAVQAWPESH